MVYKGKLRNVAQIDATRNPDRGIATIPDTLRWAIFGKRCLTQSSANCAFVKKAHSLFQKLCRLCFLSQAILYSDLSAALAP